MSLRECWLVGGRLRTQPQAPAKESQLKKIPALFLPPKRGSDIADDIEVSLG